MRNPAHSSVGEPPIGYFLFDSRTAVTAVRFLAGVSHVSRLVNDYFNRPKIQTASLLLPISRKPATGMGKTMLSQFLDDTVMRMVNWQRLTQR